MSKAEIERTPPYPLCPLCGSDVVGAMMTSGAVEHGGETYYHPRAVSVYCESATCNYDRRLSQLPAPSRVSTPASVRWSYCAVCGIECPRPGRHLNGCPLSGQETT